MLEFLSIGSHSSNAAVLRRKTPSDAPCTFTITLTKIDSVSKDLNEIENQLASVTTPINELNRFLGGNVTTGRLGEWNLESIVKEILPDGSYNFQAQINKEPK